MTVKEKAELIVRDIKKEQGTNPVRIFKNIAKKEYVSIHGPEHHILDGASLLVAFEQPRPTGRTRIPLQPSGFLTLGCIGTAI